MIKPIVKDILFLGQKLEDATKNIKKYKDAEESILKLMNNIKKFEENNKIENINNT